MDKEKRKRLRTYYERNNDVQELLTYVEGLEALVEQYERHIKDIELRCECKVVRGGPGNAVMGYAKNPQCPIHGNPGPKCRYCGMPVDVMHVIHSSEVPTSECPKPLGGPHYSVDDVGITEIVGPVVIRSIEEAVARFGEENPITDACRGLLSENPRPVVAIRLPTNRKD